MNEFLSLPKNKVCNSEIEINKSRFLGFSKHVDDVDQAKQFVEDIKKQYKDAKHVVYAYIVDGIQKSTDDGEPSGTAGRPILEFLGHLGCNRIAVVVVRYFGGIKLGTGGLLRAYVGSAKQTIENNLLKFKKAQLFEGELDYNEFESLKYEIKQSNARIISVDYGQKVKVRVASFDQKLPKLSFIGEIFEAQGGENANN